MVVPAIQQPRPNIRPSQIYPPYYYPPDTVNTPVHSDRTIAWPLFMWDTAHIYTTIPGTSYPSILAPDFYRLAVDDDPAFGSPNFQVETAGLAAAPTAQHPFDPPCRMASSTTGGCEPIAAEPRWGPTRSG